MRTVTGGECGGFLPTFSDWLFCRNRPLQQMFQQEDKTKKHGKYHDDGDRKKDLGIDIKAIVRCFVGFITLVGTQFIDGNDAIAERTIAFLPIQIRPIRKIAIERTDKAIEIPFGPAEPSLHPFIDLDILIVTRSCDRMVRSELQLRSAGGAFVRAAAQIPMMTPRQEYIGSRSSVITIVECHDGSSSFL